MIKEKQVPKDIVIILTKLHENRKLPREDRLTDNERTKLDSFLSNLETAIVNPACKSMLLVNPVPEVPNISGQQEMTAEQRIRHINSVSARIAEASQPESAEDAEDFDIPDTFDKMPKSIFEIHDHHMIDMEEDELTALEEKVEPNPDLESEAERPAPQPTEGAEQ